MSLVLYDLALADPDVRLSPFCWRVKFAMKHKGLEFETVPLRFTEKDNYPDPEHKTLPILKDGDDIICDSANIIAHIERNHAGDGFCHSDAERAACDFYQAWLASNLFPAFAPRLFARVHALAHEDDKDYFRASREKRFGKTLEELAVTPGLNEKAGAALKTLAAPLARHKFLGGDAPNLSDYIVFSPFMWQYCITDDIPYEAPQAVDAWTERMLDLFDGYGRNAKRAL